MKTHIAMQEDGNFIIIKTTKQMNEGTIEKLSNGQDVYISQSNAKTHIEEPIKIIEGQAKFFYEENEFPEPYMEK